MTEVQTPEWPYIDMGQRRCMAHLSAAYHKTSGPVVIMATSQGTATTLNFLPRDKTNRVKAVILESTMASGNSAIHHTVFGEKPSMITKSGSYYWMPYLAKIIFPLYSPSGTHAIHSIENIPTTMPVVIGHDKRDFQLSIDDARAIYYRLKEKGNPTYLIESSRGRHLGTLNGSGEVLQRILKHHKLIDSAQEVGDLSPFQPDHILYREAYQSLINREKHHVIIGYSVQVASIIITAALLYRYRNGIKRIATKATHAVRHGYPKGSGTHQARI